jgi:hypothetical protein
VTNHNTGALPASLWRSRAGASSPSVSFPGTPCAGTVLPVPRVRDRVVFALPVTQKAAPAVQLGQPSSDNYIYMTSVNAVGVGASGPPPYREPV